MDIQPIVPGFRSVTKDGLVAEVAHLADNNVLTERIRGIKQKMGVLSYRARTDLWLTVLENFEQTRTDFYENQDPQRKIDPIIANRMIGDLNRPYYDAMAAIRDIPLREDYFPACKH